MYIYHLLFFFFFRFLGTGKNIQITFKVINDIQQENEVINTYVMAVPAPKIVVLLIVIQLLFCLLFMQTQSRDRNVITESHEQKYLNSTESYSLLRNTFNDKYIFNCANIHKIHIFKNDVGQGRSKSVDIGTYNGQKVVIKKLSSFKNRVRQEYRQLLFMKEILIRDQLEYPGLIKMLGYCVRHLNSEGFQRRHPHRGDITAVYEYGLEFDIRNLTLNIEERLVHALKLADLIIYLQNSPLGSLMIGDFKDAHFIMVNNRIKLIDFDYMHNVEHPCLFLQNQPKTDCPFNIDCT